VNGRTLYTGACLDADILLNVLGGDPLKPYGAGVAPPIKAADAPLAAS
jgi:hypothetical protein